jgi:glycogen(starch) synthase
MKIGLVSFEYPPFHGGGIGTYAGIMSRWLARCGHEVHVIGNGWHGAFDGEDPADEGLEGLHVHRIHALDRDYRPLPPHDRPGDPLGEVARRWDRSLYWSTLVADRLAGVHVRHGLEVVEFPECFAEGTVVLRRRSAGLGFHDLAVCLHLHTPIRDHTELNLARTWEGWYRRRVALEEMGIRLADRLSSPSRSLAGIVAERLGFDAAERCDVIPYAMDFGEVMDEPSPDGGSPSLLFVGRVEPRKGVLDLVDAALRVLPSRPELTVSFLGRDCEAGEVPGSMVAWLRARIPDELQERFVFEGLRPREEVLRRYASSAACVFAAPWDNYPFTCMEAMAAGACVVVSDQGGMAELVEHERSGLVFPSGRVGDLAAALRRVLQNPAEVARWRRAAGARVRAVCDPETVVAHRVEHYRRTIEDHRRAALPAGAVS